MSLATHTQRLFTIGDDQILTVWDMSTERVETPTWSQSDMCEKCATPFFWNFKQMWEEKAVGVRQVSKCLMFDLHTFNSTSYKKKF